MSLLLQPPYVCLAIYTK